MKKIFLPFMIMCAALFMSQSVSAENYTIANITSNMSTNENYNLNNLTDGDFKTKFWSGGPQAANQYILVDLGTIQPLQEINLYFASGDQPTAAKIEISNDGSQYEELVSFTQSEIGGAGTNYLYSCSALNKEAQYIRFSLTAATSSWFQMTEIQIPIPDAKAPSRTITVSVNDASMGTAYIGTEGTVSQTAEGPIVLKAVSNPGYAFTSWTINGAVVARTADLIDNTEGDKNYVANFTPAPYDEFCTPAATTGGNKRAQSKGEILNATGVIAGSTMEFYPSGSTANQAWSNRSDMVKVESGATFDLKVTYGTEGWGSLSVYQMTSSDDYTMIYGSYEGAWATDAATTTLFSNINAADDLATANESDGTITFPITIPIESYMGNAVVIRFIVHKTTLNDNPCATGIEELNYCDYVFYVDKGKPVITAKADPSNGGTVAINDGTFGATASLGVEENGSCVLKAQPAESYQFIGWYDANGTQVSTDSEYTVSNITSSATYTAKFEFVEPKYILTYEVKGSGYVEVWSGDTWTESTPAGQFVKPAGEQYSLNAELPYKGNVYIFAFPVGENTLESIVVNGKDMTQDELFRNYGDIEHTVESNLHIKAVFTGEDLVSGVEPTIYDNAKIYSVKGGIKIIAESTTAKIYNMNGTCINSVNVNGTESISVPAGIYAVVINGNKACKVLVK